VAATYFKLYYLLPDLDWFTVSQGGHHMMPISSRTDRFKQGKALRLETPRETHADLKGNLSRNPVAILADSDKDRVPELVPERYARMSVDPFAFLRGAAAVMAADLAGQPTAGIPVQAGGDSHLMNFGAFVTPENNILFDVNDFDETLPGVDFTVDVKRLAASVAVASWGRGHRKRKPGPMRQRLSKPTGRIWRRWPSCRLWRYGTVESTSKKRSIGSLTAA
jgi:hypothetical protein